MAAKSRQIKQKEPGQTRFKAGAGEGSGGVPKGVMHNLKARGPTCQLQSYHGRNVHPLFAAIVSPTAQTVVFPSSVMKRDARQLA